MPTEENVVETKLAETESPTAFTDAFREASKTIEAEQPTIEKEPEEKKEEVQEEVKEEAEKEVKEEQKVDGKTEENVWKHKYDTLQGMFNKLSKDFKEMKEQISKKPVEDEPKEEQDEEIANFLTDYDYLANPTQKIIERKVKEIEDKIFASMNEQYNQTSRVIADLVISIEHPDFVKLKNTGEIRSWVDSMPDGVDKNEYTRICDEGNVSEVIQLITDYKKATGKQKKENPEKQEKITNLTAVTSKRGAINAESGGKPIGFNDAFRKRAAEIEHRR